LLRQQQYLQQGAPPTGPTVAGASLPPSIQKTPDRKSVGSPGVQGSPRKTTDSLGPPGVGPGGNTSEGVLANFFNSLLSKKTGQPGSPGTQVKSATGNDDYKAAVRSDAAAELDRLTRGAQKKPTGGSGSNSIDTSLNNSEC